MTLGSLRRRIAAAVATSIRGRPSRPSAVPVCRLTIDLDGVPWGADPETVLALLRGRPGVVDVQVDAGRRRVTVLHDSRASVPALWNWLQTQPSPAVR